MIQRIIKNISHFLGSPKYTLSFPPSSLISTARRSIIIRHLDCGRCNGCELMLNEISRSLYIGNDCKNFIYKEALPGYANILLLSGSFTTNLAKAMAEELNIFQTPLIIIVGDCACSEGFFSDTYTRPQNPEEDAKGVTIKFIAGCPPSSNKVLRAIIELVNSDLI